MKFLNRIVLVLLFISLSVSLSAQEFLWSVGVDMMFDNREYGKSKYNWPQTIFGGYINPLVGIGWPGKFDTGRCKCHAQFRSTDQRYGRQFRVFL